MTECQLEKPARDKTFSYQYSRRGTKPHPGKSYGRGRLSTVDLLVLTSLEQLLFILKILKNKLH